MISFSSANSATQRQLKRAGGSRHRGPYDEIDGERIKPLIPHLRRALEIKDRLEMARIRCDTLGKSLDSLTFGVLILDIDGHILEASASAGELMCADYGIRRKPDGTLWLREPAGMELNRWVLKGRHRLTIAMAYYMCPRHLTPLRDGDATAGNERFVVQRHCAKLDTAVVRS